MLREHLQRAQQLADGQSYPGNIPVRKWGLQGLLPKMTDGTKNNGHQEHDGQGEGKE